MCDCKIFDKENCLDCLHKSQWFDWEKNAEKASQELVEKKHKDVRREKLRQWRQCDRWREAREKKWARKMWQQAFRIKVKDYSLDDESGRPVKHEYHTGGWITW